MFSRVVFISHLSLALLACTLVLGTANVQAQTITTIAGNGNTAYSGDGGPATAAALNHPRGMALDSAGNIFVADLNNARIRKISPDGIITTVAGNGAAGYSGDGGPATAAMLNQPEAVAVDTAGNLIIADSQNRRVRNVDSSGTITTIAGTGTEGYSGDGGPAVAAMLHRAVDLAVDSAGNIYFADSVDHRVRKIDTSGTITTVAGNGTPGFSGDGGPATGAQLQTPVGVAIDKNNDLYIADSDNFRIRMVDAAGNIRTIAGNGVEGFLGDGGPATSAKLNYSLGVKVDSSGRIFIADSSNNRVRVVNGGVISTLAGTGTGGFSGDGGPAASAMLNYPWAVALDNSGSVLVGDRVNNRIRKITLGPPATPNLFTGGVVNGATFTPASNPNGAVAPGTIVAVFGTSLTGGNSCIAPTCFPSFQDGRLLTTMAGVQVTINGAPVPIFYATPTQLGVQMPMELSGSSATILVTAGGQASAQRTVIMTPASPGIFTLSQDGQGAGAITHSDQLGTLVSTQNPARPGEVVVIYATGLGQVTPAVATGMLPAGQSRTVSPVTVTIDGIPVTPDFAGVAGCCVGLNQVNVTIPSNAHSSVAIPVFLTIGGKQSNLVTIVVQQ
jgi:uncharacterized protein (TIGR03437 family)